MALDDREFAKALGEALECELGELKAVAKRFRIPLRQRHARRYIKPGFALAGDAAHTIHPLAGQGVNLGLKDVAAFVEEIQYAVERDVPISHYSVLRRYQRQRMADNLSMMAAMEGFKRLFASNDISVRWLRNEGMRSLDKVSVLKNKIVRQAMGCEIRLTNRVGLKQTIKFIQAQAGHQYHHKSTKTVGQQTIFILLK